MKGWVKIAIGAGIVGTAGYLLKMKKTSAELEIVSTAKVQKLNLSGLTIRVDVQLKNPTKGTLSMKYPFVKITYKGATIGSSQSINKDIKIPSFGEAMIEEIMIQVPITSLLSLGLDIVKALKGTEAIKLQVKTLTYVDLGFKSMPFEKIDDIILKKAPDGSN